MKKSQKGMTLTEVVISLIILVTIIVGMLTFFSNGYSRIYFLRDRNIENFEIQEDIEEKLAEFKKNGHQGNQEVNFYYNVGTTSKQIKVKGTFLEHATKAGYQVKLFVANAKEIKLPIPEDLNIQVGDRSYYYLGETTPSASYTLSYDSSVKLYLESGWFLSKRYIETNQNQTLVDIVTVGNILPKTSSLTAEESETKYSVPVIPTDFKKVKMNQQSGMVISEDMLGRFLTFSARPISSRGRVGSFQEGQRLWLMGVPVVSGLRVHIDADLALRKDGSGQIQMLPSDGKLYSNTDLKNYIAGIELADKSITMRRMFEPLIQQERQEMILNGGKKISFSNNDFSKGTTVGVLLTNQKQRGNIMTFRFNESFLWNVSLLEQGEIQIDAIDYSISSNTNSQKISTSISDLQDKSLVANIVTSNNTMTVNLFLNERQIYTRSFPIRYTQGRTTTTHNVSNGQIEFSGNASINEIAIYNRNLTFDENSKLINYYRDKYQFIAE